MTARGAPYTFRALQRLLSTTVLVGLLIAAECALLIIGSFIYLGASRHQAAQRLAPRYA